MVVVDGRTASSGRTARTCGTFKQQVHDAIETVLAAAHASGGGRRRSAILPVLLLAGSGGEDVDLTSPRRARHARGLRQCRRRAARQGARVPAREARRGVGRGGRRDAARHKWLCLAASWGEELEVVSLIPSGCAARRAHRGRSRTPLHYAALNGHARAAAAMLAHRAAADAIDADGRSPLECALEHSRHEVALVNVAAAAA